VKHQPCTASQLIARLQSLVAEHGDLPILARDADTQWRMPIGLIYRAADANYGERLEIRTDYYGAPRGYIDPSEVSQ
jgi:hypothetical protein